MTIRRIRNLTTGQVAKLANVAPRTASKWIDSGDLKGFRLPGSQDRRVEPKSLVAFFTKHGMPVPDDLTEMVKANESE